MPVATLVGLMTLVALVLVVMRGGILPWSTLVIGIGLLARIILKSHNTSFRTAIAFIVIPLLAWLGTYYYVISTWESGEVVEISVDTNKGTPLRLSRSAEVTNRIPNATRVADLPKEEFDRLLGAMNTKYASQSSASTIYFLMLGRTRDRVGVVAYLTPSPS